MGTSNWQNIPYCVDVLMKIEPRRVLDVGVGFGRWGMVLREFGEVWSGRIHPADWELHIEGIEAFAPNVTPYHEHFYDKIHLGDAADLLVELGAEWNVVLFGDVIEHMSKDTGIRLLEEATKRADYVIVNVPLGEHWDQGDAYGNPYEAHLSEWRSGDFDDMPVVRSELFGDYLRRPFGVFVLSRHDPRDLAGALFSEAARRGQGRTWREIAAAGALKAKRTAGALRRSLIRRPPPRVDQLAGLESKLGPIQEAGSSVAALAVDGWLGVTTSTQQLFEHSFTLAPDLSDEDVGRAARALAGAGVSHLVLSGLSQSRLALARELKRLDTSARVDVLWHGNYLQSREDVAWEMFRALMSAAGSGEIDRVGVVKKGMEQWLSGLGVDAALILNFVPELPEGPSVPDDGGPHMGIWLAGEGYRKLPYAMIAAAGMIPGATIRGSGVSSRAREFASFVGLDQDRLRPTPVSHQRLLDEMARTHLTLYVTLSECGPMLPMESLSVGVPCLIGPNSHVFADDEYLAERLVVPYPEHAEVIARYAQTALTERDQIVEAYRAYAPGYIERARRSVEEFLA